MTSFSFSIASKARWAIKSSPSKPALASVVIKPDNTITLNNKTVDLANIESAILAAVAEDEEKVVELYGDVESNYGTVFDIIEISKRNRRAFSQTIKGS